MYWYMVWRCRALTLEFQWRRVADDQAWRAADLWLPRLPKIQYINGDDQWDPTPERMAMWLDLFLHP